MCRFTVEDNELVTQLVGVLSPVNARDYTRAVVKNLLRVVY